MITLTRDQERPGSLSYSVYKPDLYLLELCRLFGRTEMQFGVSVLVGCIIRGGFSARCLGRLPPSRFLGRAGDTKIGAAGSGLYGTHAL